jgi:uncharacterized protein YndB with AHSA1/START domain
VAQLNLIAEPGKQELIMIRLFDAPRELVFRIYTDPRLIPYWWGPQNETIIVEEMDVRPGGSWRYIHRDAGGHEYAFRGVYHEVLSPDRLVYTFEFEGMPGHILLETVTFGEQGGKTMLMDHSVFQTLEDRDGIFSSELEKEALESMDRFDELLAYMRKGGFETVDLGRGNFGLGSIRSLSGN